MCIGLYLDNLLLMCLLYAVEDDDDNMDLEEIDENVFEEENVNQQNVHEENITK